MKGLEALALMTVSDMIGQEDGNTVRISDDEMKRGVDQMMEIGCRVAVSWTPCCRPGSLRKGQRPIPLNGCQQPLPLLLQHRRRTTG